MDAFFNTFVANLTPLDEGNNNIFIDTMFYHYGFTVYNVSMYLQAEWKWFGKGLL